MISLTESDDREQLQRWRLAQALLEAPDLVTQARRVALSHPEAGETDPQQNSPLRVTALDDSDAAYVVLVQWATYFAERLNLGMGEATLALVRAAGAAHQNGLQGFPAHTTPTAARALTATFTLYLTAYQARIERAPGYLVYRRDILDRFALLKGRYPVEPRPVKPTQARTCPECTQQAVRAEWSLPGMSDARVYCLSCGHDLPVTPAIIASLEAA